MKNISFPGLPRVLVVDDEEGVRDGLRALLQQEGLHHRLEGGGIFPQARRQGVEPHRAAAIAVLQQLQQSPIAGIEAAAIHPVQAEGFMHQNSRDPAMAAHGSHIAHPPEQPVCHARRASRSARDLERRIRLDLDAEDSSHDTSVILFDDDEDADFAPTKPLRAGANDDAVAVEDASTMDQAEGVGS